MVGKTSSFSRRLNVWFVHCTASCIVGKTRNEVVPLIRSHFDIISYTGAKKINNEYVNVSVN